MSWACVATLVLDVPHHHHLEHWMNVELQNPVIVAIEEQPQYRFVIDAELASVGGGSAMANY
jgi:hypothetical protein